MLGCLKCTTGFYDRVPLRVEILGLRVFVLGCFKGKLRFYNRVHFGVATV